MVDHSRRRVLRLGATGLSAAVAGCSGIQYEIETRRDDRVVWSTTLGVPISLAVDDGTLFVMTNESVSGVDPTDGDHRWETSLPKEEGRVCYSPPMAVEDGSIYVSGCRGTFAFDYDGRQNWHSGEPRGVAAFVPTADRLYASRGAELYTIAADSGELRTSALVSTAANTGFAGPTAGPEWFYYSKKGRASDDIGLLAVDPATTEKQWELDLDSPGLSHAPTYDDGMLYVASSDSERGEYDINNLYAVDAESQTIEWDIQTRAVYSAPVATSDRIVFASADRDDSYIRSVRRSSGTDDWTTSFTELTGSIDMIRVHGETVYAVLDSDEVIGLDLTDGSERWRFSKRGHVDALPMPYEELLLVPTGNRVWALDRTALGDG